MYGSLGVDVRKKGVEAFRGSVESIFPNSFCIVQRDPDDPGRGLVSHTDGAGSKPVQSYLHWRETGDASWFKGLAQDVVAMNLDDIICVGAKPVAFIDYVTLNTLLIDRVKLLSAIADGFSECFSTLASQGIRMPFAGGETADHPDQLRTLDVAGSIFGRLGLKDAVTSEMIAPGDVIVGLRSGGRAEYEGALNSGIMCNGLTLARSSLMEPGYLDKYTELAQPGRTRYTGRFRFDDRSEGLGMTVGEALLSPTRIFAPIVAAALAEFGGAIHGMVHNTGGGVTKCLHLGRGVRYVKDTLPEPDPIFELIRREAKVDWREMYEDFNMGVGFEFIVDAEMADDVVGISKGFGVGAQEIGHCERLEDQNVVTIKTKHGDFEYRQRFVD
jgi:phosphoribosylformylglycinamidine cyclo-ligase